MAEEKVITIYVEDGKIKDKEEISDVINYKTLKGIIDNFIKYSNEEDESSLYIVYKNYCIILQKDLFYEDQDNYFIYIVEKNNFNNFIKSKKIIPTEVPARKIVKENKTVLFLFIIFLLILLMIAGIFIYTEKQKKQQRIVLEKIKQEQIKKEQEEKKLIEEQQKKQTQLQQIQQADLLEQKNKSKIKSINAIILAINNIDEQKKKYNGKVGIKQISIIPEQVSITYELDNFHLEANGTYDPQTNTIVYTKEEKFNIPDKDNKIIFSQRKKNCLVEISNLKFKFNNSNNGQITFNINQQIKINNVGSKKSSQELLSFVEAFLKQLYYTVNSCGNNVSITNLTISENSVNGTITLWL